MALFVSKDIIPVLSFSKRARSSIRVALLWAFDGMDRVVLSFLFLHYGVERIRRNMTIINSAAGQTNKQIHSTQSPKMLQEFNLLLDEIETKLEEELIAIHLLRKSEQPFDPKMILELAIQIFSRKKNRTIKEESILAYAQTRLKQLTMLMR
jgi:hypothetical protein